MTSRATWIAGCLRCRGHLLQLTHDAGFRPDVAYETEDYVAVMGLVAEGLGVALIPDLILRTVHHGDVVALPITPASRRSIMAVTTPDLQRVPAGEGDSRRARRERQDAVEGAHGAGRGARILDLSRPRAGERHRRRELDVRRESR